MATEESLKAYDSASIMSVPQDKFKVKLFRGIQVVCKVMHKPPLPLSSSLCQHSILMKPPEILYTCPVLLGLCVLAHALPGKPIPAFQRQVVLIHPLSLKSHLFLEGFPE